MLLRAITWTQKNIGMDISDDIGLLTAPAATSQLFHGISGLSHQPV